MKTEREWAQWFGSEPGALTDAQRRVLRLVRERLPVTLNTNEVFEERLSFGERLSDSIARIGGSWPFIIGFCLFLGLWALGNVWLSTRAFDPYPFIFLNLLLSMLASIQAPIIMMAQNRQSRHDRIAAGHDYEVNLKAEVDIMALHDKLDQLRNEELVALLRRIDDLGEAIRRLERSAGAGGT